MGHLLLVTGGTRSGKSRYAVERASAWGSRVLYVATCQPADDEMRERVRRHQAERPSTWTTVEPGSDVLPAVQAARPQRRWHSAGLPHPLCVELADVRQRRGRSDATGR